MNEEPGTVYLVDGSSYIYRAYHAIRNLSNSKGFPTNAIFGFSKMILKLINDKAPKYMAVAFDAKGPTFRHDIYEAYKATRPPMPEELVAQISYIHEVVDGLNVLRLEKPGFEADDILGTLARIGEESGFDVVIVTGDKDFRQLVSPHISLLDTMKDRYTDYDTLVSEYGLEPSQIIDLMGLSGDSSDNIPGVPGVGEKTAAKLIQEYGSMERVFENIEALKGKKLKENLERSRENAFLSRKLVTIDCSVPLDKGIVDLKTEGPDREALAKLFRDLEFKGLWEQFASREGAAEKDYRLCLSEELLRSLTEEIIKKGVVSVDTETTSEDPLLAELVGISVSFEKHRATYLPLTHQYLGAPKQIGLDRAIEILKPVLEDETILKIGQNIKYDALVFKRYGVDLGGIHFDTMVASYVINPGLRQHNLDALAQHYLNHKMIAYHELVGKGRNQTLFSEVDVRKAMEYSCEDADITFILRDTLESQLESDLNQDLFYDLEMKVLPVLTQMEWIGIKIDAPFFRDMSLRFTKQIKALEEEIYEEAGMTFNINSSQQLGHILFEKLQLPVQKKTAKTKAYSTDVNVLKKLSALPFRIPKLLLRYRTLTKLKSTYLDSLVNLVNPGTGRIHTSFNQTVAATGRLSSSNPNLQNIPIKGEEGREIRKGFVADKGFQLLSADYSQVELRIFAHYSGDPAFMEAFKKDQDIHSRTASEILDVTGGDVTPEMRRIAKAINFGIIYGMGPQKLGQELGIDVKTAKNYISAYYDKYQGVAKYREETVSFAKENGYVTTLFGRRRYLPDIHHKNRIIQAEAERMAINTPIQGTAADLIKKAMIHISDRIRRDRLKTRMLLQVHDELVFEVPGEEIESVRVMVKEEMEGVHTLHVPLKVDVNVGQNWDEAH